MTKVRVTTEKSGHVMLIGLNRADKYNAFDVRMLGELAQAYTAFEEDADARCALLFAHGDNFTSGLDLADVGPAFAAGEALFPAACVDPLGLGARRRTKPVVMAAYGYCFTIGMELAMACDVVVAARDTVFGQIEVQRGIMPFGGATLRFPQIVGWHDAMRYLLTGDRFDGEEAYRIGFAQEVAEDRAGAYEAGLELATRIAAQAPLAVSASLVNARLAVEQGFDAAHAELVERARALMTTEDAMEGMQSFLERRAAQFKGR